MGFYKNNPPGGLLMLNAVSQKFHAWTTGGRVLFLFIADAVMMGYIMPVASAILELAANNSVLPLDLMFFYSPAAAFAMLQKYGQAGRELYTKIELTADIIYPIIYTLFFGLLISWLFQRAFRPDSKMQKWNVAPVGAWFFDLLENIGIVTMLVMYPSQPVLLAWLTMLLGLLKWVMAFLSGGLVLVGVVGAAKNHFRKQE
jgi:hypothetical protein